MDVNAPGAPRKQESKSFATEQEAVRWVAKRQTEAEAGSYVEPHKLTTGAYLDGWLERTADLAGWSENTRADYGRAVRRLIKPKLGAVPLQQLTTDHVKALYAYLLREGRVGKDGVRGALSRKSVQNVNICLRSALQDAVETDPPLLRRNPASKAFSFSRQKHRSEMKVWTAQQVQRFLDFVASEREAAFWRTAFVTGARRGELLGLRRQDVDLDHARLQIRQQFCKNGARGPEFKGLKTGSAAWRTLDLDPVTVEQLRTRLEVLAFERRRDDYQDHDLLFGNQDGTPCDPDATGRRFGRRATEAGLSRIRFHDIRHTNATLLLEAGESIKLVAERLGDRVETVIETYAHVTSKARTQAPSRLAAILDAPRPARADEAQS